MLPATTVAWIALIALGWWERVWRKKKKTLSFQAFFTPGGPRKKGIQGWEQKGNLGAREKILEEMHL